MAGSWDTKHVNYFGDNTPEDVTGSSKNEFIRGSGGDDTLKGLGGRDYIWGDAGLDTLEGGDGHDSLEGGADNDKLFGGEGNDRLSGYNSYSYEAAAIDKLYGEAGDDELSSLSPSVAGGVAHGGDGTDTAWIGNHSNSTAVGAMIFALSSSAAGSKVNVGGTDGLRVVEVERIVFYAGAGADEITGGALDDKIYAFDGSDILKGLAGNDWLDGGKGIQDIDGGAGIDTVSFDLSSATVAFNLSVTSAQNNLTLSLGPSAEFGTLKAVEGFGTIKLGSGGDKVSLGSRGGTVHGNAGADELTGGNGKDVLYGGTGADTLIGGDGNDVLDAGYMDGSAAENSASAASDLLEGGDGNDILWGGIGADTLKGGIGNDALGYYLLSNQTVDAALDKFAGGSGNDTFKVDVLLNYVGQLEITLDPTGSTYLKLGGSTVVEATSMEALDITAARSTSNTITGGDRADYVYSSDGDDVLTMLGGNDFVSANEGSDTIDMGGGNDVLFATLGGTDKVQMGAGNDQMRIESPYGSTPSLGASVYDFGSGAADQAIVHATDNNFDFDGERIYYNDKLSATLSGHERITYYASQYESTVYKGTSLDEELRMGSYADTASGGGGNDVITGGAGEDILDGGEGTDTLSYAGEYSSYTIVLDGDQQSTTTFELSGQIRIADYVRRFENVVGGSYNDTITGDGEENNLDGGNGDDNLAGAGAGDVLDGDYGEDELLGGKGNDRLIGSIRERKDENGLTYGGAEEDGDKLDGGADIDTADYSNARTKITVALDGATYAVVTEVNAGNDKVRNVENFTGGTAGDRITGDNLANVLKGGGGGDVLSGGEGKDVLWGQGGADHFRFNDYGRGDQDEIKDFDRGVDHLVFKSSTFGDLRSVKEGVSYIENASGQATDRDHRFILDKGNGVLRFDEDGSRTAHDAVIVATLNVKNLSAGDFLFA